jgi:bifunctional DNA-binding transcriptional regulator/antitoxin component of YhaV-PrlF toxin-antitoxin module
MGLLTDTKINSNLTTVPEAVRNYLSLESGDRVEWYVEGGEVVVRRKEDATADEAAGAANPAGTHGSGEGS